MNNLINKLYRKLLFYMLVAKSSFRSLFRKQEYLYLSENNSKHQLVDLGDRLLYADPNDPNIGKVIIQRREYEPHVTAVIKKVLSPCDTFVDIGANIGYFTTLAASIVGGKGTVVAIEPNPTNVKLLYSTIEKNKYENVIVHPFAASNQTGVVQMISGGSNATVIESSSEDLNSFSVKTIVLDDLLMSEERIDVVKIDVEGQELNVFLGFKELLTKFQPIYITEFHPWVMERFAKSDPLQYLVELFGLYKKLFVIEHSTNNLIECASEIDVMKEHEKINLRLGMGNKAHLDLVAFAK